MSDLTNISLPIKNPSTGVVTNQEFSLKDRRVTGSFVIVSGTKTTGSDLVIQNENITDDMVCVHIEVAKGNSALERNWLVSTSDGAVTVSGDTNFDTSVKLYLLRKL